MLGNRIKLLREEKNINQDVLAKLLGLEIAGISKLETGRVPLKDEYIVRLAEYFGVSTDYLLGKSDIRNPGKQIDDVLNEAMIGMSKEEYEALTETQKKQIRDFALFVKNQNDKKDN